MDVDDEVRRRRIEERDPGTWDVEAQRAFLGWARWHRGHAGDPRHQPEAIRPGWDRMRWERWSAWTGADPRWRVSVIDTTDRTVPQSAADIRQWITTARAEFAAGRLSLAGGWTTGRGAF